MDTYKVERCMYIYIYICIYTHIKIDIGTCLNHIYTCAYEHACVMCGL